MSRPSLKTILTDRTLALMLALGFSSGLPFLLVLGTQAARLTEAQVPIEKIGLISWVGLCYSLKFLWAPVIDEVNVPGLARLLGRRRAWMVVAQVGVAAGLVALAFADPAHALSRLIAVATLTAFAAATQDIVIDGWRIDSAPPERQGVMAATSNFGYRLGLFAAGAGALYIADWAGWTRAYLAMAMLMLVGLVAGLLSPRLPDRARHDAPTAVPAPTDTPRLVTRPPGRIPLAYRLGILMPGAIALLVFDLVGWASVPTAAAIIPALAIILAVLPARALRSPFIASYIAPVLDLARRYGWLLAAILLLVALYRLPDFLSGVMANPLYIKLGFTKSEIATMTKVYAIWIGIAGAFAGGFVITRVGLMPALLAGGIAAAASHLALALLAASGKSAPLLALSVSAESFAGNFAGAALIAYMSSLTTPALAASQYALLSSLYALLGKFFGGFSGYAVKAVGFPTFFAATSTIGIPVAALCLLLWARQRGDGTAVGAGLADDGEAAHSRTA